MKNDSTSDFLARIKNAYGARHKTLEAPYAKILLEIGKILAREKFISDIKSATKDGKKTLVVTLSYPQRKPALTNLRRVSKPGLRVYVSKKNIPWVYGGLGVVILSTPKGILTGKEAKKQDVGGELVCKVW